MAAHLLRRMLGNVLLLLHSLPRSSGDGLAPAVGGGTGQKRSTILGLDGHPGHGTHGRDESNTNIMRRPDSSSGSIRTEVICKQCDAYLGHVFDDGPTPSGQRFCINSVSLNFKRGSVSETWISVAYRTSFHCLYNSLVKNSRAFNKELKF